MTRVCIPDANFVIVVDMEGRFRFRYDGKPAKREMSFDPRGIVTDDLSQIIEADLINDCLLILDNNGHLLRCVDDCGLEEPNGLSMDSEGIREIRRNQSYRVFSKHIDHNKILIGLHLTHVLTLFF